MAMAKSWEIPGGFDRWPPSTNFGDGIAISYLGIPTGSKQITRGKYELENIQNMLKLKAKTTLVVFIRSF